MSSSLPNRMTLDEIEAALLATACAGIGWQDEIEVAAVSALEVLEQTVRVERHALSRSLAKAMLRAANDLMREGYPADSVYGALDLIYARSREDGHDVERDAAAEVTDWFEDEGLVQTP